MARYILRVLQILVVIDRRGVNERLHQLQRQRDEVAGHHGFKQQAQLVIEIGEARAQFVMVV